MPFVYKITSPHTDKIYVGSTTLTLGERFKQHRKKGNPTRSKQIMDLGDAVIECLEEVAIDEMLQRERYHIELMWDKCVNRKIPLRTQKEWVEDNTVHYREYHCSHYLENKERISERCKLFYENNKEQRLEREREAYADMEVITCACGSSYKKKHHPKHLKTKNHLGLI